MQQVTSKDIDCTALLPLHAPLNWALHLLAGLEMLQEVANVDCSYNLTPEELNAKIALSDALVVRSATKVWGLDSSGCCSSDHVDKLTPTHVHGTAGNQAGL